MSNYSYEDIVLVNVEKWILKNPKMFFRNDIPSAEEISFWVLTDIYFAGGDVSVCRVNDWWVISSNIDWVVDPEISFIDLFKRVVSDPRRGANSMRSEVVVAAYCSDIYVEKNGLHSRIKGNAQIPEFNDKLPFVLAFIFNQR
jgi:hypothetical protein